MNTERCWSCGTHLTSRGACPVPVKMCQRTEARRQYLILGDRVRLLNRYHQLSTECVECRTAIPRRKAFVTTVGDIVCAECADQRV